MKIDRHESTTPEHAALSLRGIHQIEPDVYEVTSEGPPHGGSARLGHRLNRFLLGPPLPSGRERRERLTWITALAILGADAIASSVYGPEEILRMLSLAGVSSITQYTLPITIAIVVVLGILAFSYWQTISAYPNGAGGYIVATDNLGRLPGIVSAAALLIDYNLDVAVSVASGIETVTSTLAVLAPWKVPLALAALVLITLANLRGIRAAGMLLSAPIYLYVFGTLAVVALGIFQWITGTLPPYAPPEAAQELLSHPAETFGLLLLLRAFSSGAVALTGVEAISNGIPYFKPDERRNAQRTLFALAVIFGALMLGIGFLAAQIGIVPDPTETETVHSQLTRTILGSGPLHVILEASALLLLVLAADTGFADFPRLLSLLARDGYLPAAFAVRGARLAFSNGIVLVAAISAVLILAFQASVTALVPLFTVGAFATFTLSQAGMARHWSRRRNERGWELRMFINGLGAVVTTVVLVVVTISKFAYGAWLVVLLIPLLVWGLHTLGVHHDRVVRQLRVATAHAAEQLLASPLRQHVVITVGRVDRAALRAVAFARTLEAADIEAVFITDDRAQADELREKWHSIGLEIRLVTLLSPVRSNTHALERYLDFIQKRVDPHCFVTVVLPEIQPTRWWHPLIHNYFAWRLKWTMLFRPNAIVVSVPHEIRD